MHVAGPCGSQTSVRIRKAITAQQKLTSHAMPNYGIAQARAISVKSLLPVRQTLTQGLRMLAFLLSLTGPLLTVASAAVAVVGNTWDASKSGLERLTPTGRWAVLIAVCGFGLSSYQAYQVHVRTTSIEAIAYRDLRDGWSQLVIPFHQILWALKGERGSLGVEVFAELRENSRLKKADLVEYDGTPPLDLYDSWGMVLCQPTHAGLSKLKVTVASYQETVSPDVLDLVRNLSSDPMMRNFRRVGPCGTLNPANGFMGWWDNDSTRTYMDLLESLGKILE